MRLPRRTKITRNCIFILFIYKVGSAITCCWGATAVFCRVTSSKSDDGLAWGTLFPLMALCSATISLSMNRAVRFDSIICKRMHSSKRSLHFLFFSINYLSCCLKQKKEKLLKNKDNNFHSMLNNIWGFSISEILSIICFICSDPRFSNF